MIKCKQCGTEAMPTKTFNWVAFILLAGIFYLIYYWSKPSRVCPVCGGNIYPVKYEMSKDKTYLDAKSLHRLPK